MRRFTWLIALAIPVTIISCQKDGVQPANEEALVQGNMVTGNGAPSGAHYNLNIIGVPNGKSADMTGNNGGRIFVNLDGKTRINLSKSPTDNFQVTDANGTDADGAAFTLPDPDPNTTGTTRYSVFARVPGNRGEAKATLTTCADGIMYQDVEYPVALDCEGVTFSDNYKKFTNVSAQLLYVTILVDVSIDTDNDGINDYTLKAGRYPIFDERLYGFFWDYDNQGLKILQLRFYWVPTTVTGVVPQ